MAKKPKSEPAPTLSTNAPVDEPAPSKVFTEAEYRADAKSVVTHAVATGSATVVRADGTPRVVVSIPPPDPVLPTKAQHEAVELLAVAIRTEGLSVTARLDAAEALMHPEARDFLILVEEAVAFLLGVAGKKVNADPRERVRAMSILLKNPIR